jgi:6-pyruvoyltetrahydropterin/6-carboxytetrahydropterin synthase
MTSKDKYTLKIEIKFRYGHRLMKPYIGKCNNIHGEGGTAIVEIQSKELDKNGMVEDFGVLKAYVREWIMENWDHSYIHHAEDKYGTQFRQEGLRTFSMGYENPSAENMARRLYEVVKSQYPDVKRVGIVESFEDSIAYYEEEQRL